MRSGLDSNRVDVRKQDRVASAVVCGEIALSDGLSVTAI